MNDTIKIVLVDDEILFRKGISFLLEREASIEVLYEASHGVELIDFLKQATLLPDIVITDLKMPLLDGVEVTKIIHKEFPSIKVIALTSYDSNCFVANMIDIGAASYVLKNATPNELIKTITEVAVNGFYYNDNVLKIMRESDIVNRNSNNSVNNHFLTNREIEILQLICRQKTTVEISQTLCISPRTVEGHRNNLLLKTESKNIAGLVLYAIQNNLLVVYS
jgi:DNA-binding NarL/FixJ family response regulator